MSAPASDVFNNASIIGSVVTAMQPWRDTLCINSCIEQVRMLYDVLPHFGLTVRPLQVDLMVVFPEGRIAFAVASKAFQRRLMKGYTGEVVRDSPNLKGGFLGHMVAVVSDTILLDPTISQARFPHLGLDVGIEFHAAHSERPVPNRFYIEQEVVNEAGLTRRLCWRSTGRKEYEKCAAWEPEPQPIIDAIVARAKRLLPEGQAKVAAILAAQKEART